MQILSLYCYYSDQSGGAKSSQFTVIFESPLVFPQIDLMPHDVITQLLRVLAIETKQEKAIINADATDVALSGLEAFSFDYIVKWPLSLIINRFSLFTVHIFQFSTI